MQHSFALSLTGVCVAFSLNDNSMHGQLVDESEYIGEDVETNFHDTFTVPDNTVFVMGDNREYSYDSRFLE